MQETPSQTAGPYVHIGCVPSAAGLRVYEGKDLGADMITGSVVHRSIELTIKIHDGAGDVVRDAMVEIWQPGPTGGFGDLEHFSNWGRQPTQFDTGIASFTTLKPGASAVSAPHVLVWIVARGINLGLTTRIYFDDEGDQNERDPVYLLAGSRAKTLLARKTNGGFHHDIYLQGDRETVFFDV